MPTLLAISNAAAGSSDAAAVDAAVAALGEHWEVSTAATGSADDLAAALHDHPDVDVVAALGGDGSLHAVVQALYDAGRLTATAVALVPLGTGNDFARTLGLPEDPVAAAVAVAAGSVRPIDLIVDDTGTVVVNAAHIGIGADAGARAAPLKRFLGPVAYPLGALSTLFTPAAEVRIEIDGTPRRGRVAQVAVGNGRFVGGGGELLPRAVPDDGLLDVAVAFAATVRQRVLYAVHLRRGTHPDQDFVLYTRASTVAVRGADLRSTTDGELADARDGHSWRVVPAALGMLLPDPAPAV